MSEPIDNVKVEAVLCVDGETKISKVKPTFKLRQVIWGSEFTIKEGILNF